MSWNIASSGLISRPRVQKYVIFHYDKCHSRFVILSATEQKGKFFQQKIGKAAAKTLLRLAWLKLKLLLQGIQRACQHMSGTWLIHFEKQNDDNNNNNNNNNNNSSSNNNDNNNEYQGGTLSGEIITGNALDLHCIRYDLVSNYRRTSITWTRITRIPSLPTRTINFFSLIKISLEFSTNFSFLFRVLVTGVIMYLEVWNKLRVKSLERSFSMEIWLIHL